jgi:hypothetical protein
MLLPYQTLRVENFCFESVEDMHATVSEEPQIKRCSRVVAADPQNCTQGGACLLGNQCARLTKSWRVLRNIVISNHD